MDSYREIENLIYTYAERLDAGDLEGVAELFSHAEFYGPEGELVAQGAEDFLGVTRSFARIYPETGTPCTRHVTTNVIIELDDDGSSASSRSYFTVLQATAELPLQAIIAGRYLDRFECVDGSWRFTRRQTIPVLVGDVSKHLLSNF